MDRQMQTLTQFSRGIRTVRGVMNHRHKEARIWYVLIVDRRITDIGIAHTLRDQIIHRKTKILDHHSGRYQRVQEEVHLRHHHQEKVIKGVKARVRRVRTTLRTRTLRVKVRGKAVRAQGQR